MSNNKNLGINIYAVLKIDESDINNQVKKISDLVNNSGQKIVLPIQFDDSKMRELNTLLANIQSSVSKTAQGSIINTESIRQADEEVKKLGQDIQNVTSDASKYSFGGGADSIKTIKGEFYDIEEAFKAIQKLNIGEITKNAFADADNNIQSFIFTVKSASGTVEKFRYAWQEASEEELKAEGYYLQNIQESDAAVKRLLESQAKWRDSVEATKTKYNGLAESLETLWKSSDTGKPLFNEQHTENLNAQYGMLLSRIKELDSAESTNIASRKAAIEAEITTIKALVKEYKDAEHVATNLRGVDPTNPEVFKKFSSEFDSLQTKIQASGKGIFGSMADDVNSLKAALDAFEKDPSKVSMQAFLDKMAEVKARFTAESSLAGSFDKISKEALKLSNSLNSLAGQDIFRKYATDPSVEEFKNRINDIVVKLNELRQNVTNTPAEKRSEYLVQYTEELERLSQEFERARTEAITFKTSLRNDKEIVKNRRDIQQLTAQITEYMNANTKAAQKYGGEFQNILNGLKMPNIAKNSQQIQNLSAEFDALRTKINLAGDAGVTLGQRLATAIKGLPIVGMYLSINSLAMRAVRNIREMINTVVELDTSMTALKRVTNETAAGYDTFLKNATQQAIDLHATITDLVDQTTTWVKLGNSLEESSALARISMMYSKVGDVDNDTAVKNLVSTMKAFNIEGEESIRIVDMLDKLNNEFAVTAADLGEELSISGSAMSAAGNSLEKTLALLTGGTEITQKPREFANALRTMTMRIRSMKGALEELGEEYENVQSISKIQTQILNYTGVNIFDENENFRDTYDILKDISEVYFELKDTAKADLTEILFGKLRANQGVALLQAFQSGQVQKAYEATLKSAGTATTEFEKWEESLQAHIESYKAAVQGLAQTAIDDRGIRNIVDFGTGAIQTLDKIIEKFGSLQTLTVALAASLSAFKNIGVFTTMTDSMTGATNQLAIFGKTFAQIKADMANARGIGKVGAIFSRPIISKTDLDNLRAYGNALGSGVKDLGAFEVGFKNASSSTQILKNQIIELNAQREQGIISQDQYNARLNAMTASTEGATFATQALGTALKIAFNIGIMVVINLLIQGISELVHAEEKAAEARKEAAQKAEEEREAIEDLYQTYIDTKDALQNGTASKWDLRDATDALIQKLRIERDVIDELIDKYGDFDTAIKAVVSGATLDQIIPQKDTLKDARDTLKSTVFDFWRDDTIGSEFIDLTITKWFNEWNEKQGNVFNRNTAKAGFKFDFGGYANGQNNATVDEIRSEFEQLNKLSADLVLAGLDNTEFYKSVRTRRERISIALKDYTDSLDKYNKKVANYVVEQHDIISEELPKTYEDYLSYRNKILESANNDYVNLFEGNNEDIERALSQQLLTDADLRDYEQRLQNRLALEKKYADETAKYGISVTEKDKEQLKGILDSLTDEELENARNIPHLFVDGLDVVTQKISDFKSDPENQIEAEDILPSKDEFEAEYNKRKHWLTMGVDDSENAYKDEDFYAWLNDRETGYKHYFSNLEKYQTEYWKYEEEVFKWQTETADKRKEQAVEQLKNASNLISKAKSMSAAFKEQAENGNIAAETALSIVENGYETALMYDKETGEIKLNADAYKLLAKAEIEKSKADIESQISDAQKESINTQRNLVSSLGKSYFDATGKLITYAEAEALISGNDELVKALQARLDALNKFETELDDVTNPDDTGDTKTDDIAKQNFDKFMKDIEHRHAMGLASEEEYYNALEKANETYYKNVADHESDYLSNIEKIYNGRQKLYKEAADKELAELDKKLKLGYIKQEEYDKSLVDLAEKYYGKGTTYAGTSFAAENYQALFDKSTENDQTQYKEQFEKALEELDKKLEKGIVTVQEYRSEYGKLREEWWGVGSRWSGTTFADDMYKSMTETLSDVDSLYEEKLSNIAKANDGSLSAQQEYTDKWLSLIKKFYEGSNPAKFKSEYEKYAKSVVDNLKDMLDKELITHEEYISRVTELFESAESKTAEIGQDTLSEWINIDDYDNLLEELKRSNDKTLESEEEFVREWKKLNSELYEGKDNAKFKSNFKEITEYQLNLLKEQYDNGLISAKEYFDGVTQLLSDTDTLGKDFVSEKLKDAWEVRVKNEQTYWEQQKTAMESYYDKQIAELEKVEDEQEKITKQQELQLNLIKAQNKLEEAKKNRNQLVFVNGGFEYMADQDAILSAEEDVSEALKAIADNQLTEQVNLLKEQKEQQGKYYDALLKEIDFYINKTVQLTESDAEVLREIRESPNADYARKLENGEVKPDNSDISGMFPYEGGTLAKADVEKAAKVLTSITDFSALVKTLGGNATEQGISNFISGAKVAAMNFAKQAGEAYGGTSALAESAKEFVKRDITVGDVHVHATINLESLDEHVDEKIGEFAETIGQALKTEISRAIATV